MSDTLTIGTPALTVTVARRGAELQRIVDAGGRDLLWSGDPAWWSGRAPLLFPIVGALAGDAYRLDGRTFHLPKHGFARTSDFAVAHVDAASAELVLTDDEATHAAYPFAFALTVRFEVVEARLRVAATVANRGDAPMPASFGFHPALRWPLPGAGERDDHILIFDADPGPLRRIGRDGLLRPGTLPSPIEDRVLAPRDALFEDDALIFTGPAARAAWFGVPGQSGVSLHWDLPMLGIWTRPGAPFLCVEPWAGVADPVGYDGDFRTKPGVLEVAPGDERTFTLFLEVEPA